MKRLTIAIVLVGWLVLLGYATVLSASSPTAPRLEPTSRAPEPRPTPRVPTDKTYYTKRCWPACHYMPEKISADPGRITYDFESALGSGWEWINEDAARWNLTEAPEALKIVSQSGSIDEQAGGLQGAQNVLVRDASEAEFFDILTRVTFDPSSSLQEAGLFIQMSDGSLVSLSRGYCSEEYDAACVGSGVYFDGSGIGCSLVGAPISAETVALMLRQAGNSYVGYYCLGDNLEPEAEWVEVGRCYNHKVSPARVGLAVTNGADAPEIPAEFDLFTTVERE